MPHGWAAAYGGILGERRGRNAEAEVGQEFGRFLTITVLVIHIFYSVWRGRLPALSGEGLPLREGKVTPAFPTFF